MDSLVVCIPIVELDRPDGDLHDTIYRLLRRYNDDQWWDEGDIQAELNSYPQYDVDRTEVTKAAATLTTHNYLKQSVAGYQVRDKRKLRRFRVVG